MYRPLAGQRRRHRAAGGLRRLPRHRHRRREPHPPLLGLGDAGVLRAAQGRATRSGTPSSSTSTCGRPAAPSCSSSALAAMLRYTAARPPDQGHPGQPRPGPDHRHRRRHGSTWSCSSSARSSPAWPPFWYGLKYTVDPAMGFNAGHLRLRRRLPRRHRPLADPGLPRSASSSPSSSSTPRSGCRCGGPRRRCSSCSSSTSPTWRIKASKFTRPGCAGCRTAGRA